MDRASVERLRFDRRLSRRRDWVEESEVEQYLESLPDVSGKMATIGDLEAEAGSEAAESATAEQAAPASESFGGSTRFGGGGFGGAGSA
jgi:hypothetical protein